MTMLTKMEKALVIKIAKEGYRKAVKEGQTGQLLIWRMVLVGQLK